MKKNNNNNNKKNAKNKNFVSPYQQAGSILNQVWAASSSNNNNNNSRSSLKSVVYDASSGNLKCSASTYAICAKVLANASILQSVLERAAATAATSGDTNSNIMGINDIQNEGLFHVLLYELLLGPNKAIRGGGALKRQILKHETVLRLALADIQKETSSSSSLKDHDELLSLSPFPRYVRVNTLRTTMSRAVATWRQEHQQKHQVDEKKKEKEKKSDDKHSTSSTKLVFYQDAHVPDLMVFPHSATRALLSSSLSRNHEVILQDKSSCFPALCLVHGFDEYSNDTSAIRRRRVYLDACAAPGNKTSHLAALALDAATRTTKQQHPHPHTDVDNDEENNNDDTFPIQVYALDRSKDRCEALKRRMKQLLPDSSDKVQIHAQCRDFLSLGRPSIDANDNNNSNTKKNNKKPQRSDNDEDHAMVHQVTDILLDPSCSGSGIFHRSNDNEHDDSSHSHDESHRLQSLSNFQTTALRHALTNFANAQRVVYSTCSIHEQENEGVVADVLNDADINSKWQLVAPTCLRDWKRRGQQQQQQEQKGKDKKSAGSAGLTKEQLAKLIRVDRDDETNGFFVACFARKEDHATPSSHANEKKKKSNAKSALPAGAEASMHVVVEPIPNVLMYNGQFKMTPATMPSQTNSHKTESSSSKKKDRRPLKKTDAKANTSNTSSVSGKKRKSESATEEASNKSKDNLDQQEEGHQSSKKKKKNKTANKPSPTLQQSDSSTTNTKTAKNKQTDATEEPEKPLRVPTKVAKKLEWKRMQRQSKVQRLHSKQKQKKP